MYFFYHFYVYCVFFYNYVCNPFLFVCLTTIHSGCPEAGLTSAPSCNGVCLFVCLWSCLYFNLYVYLCVYLQLYECVFACLCIRLCVFHLCSSVYVSQCVCNIIGGMSVFIFFPISYTHLSLIFVSIY